MLVALLMGFACGLPLLLTITVLQAWMKDQGVDLTVIGMMWRFIFHPETGAMPGLLSNDDQQVSLACERLIRSYDPCISCSTHFLKLEVQRT